MDLGIDIGGTEIKYGVLEGSCRIIAKGSLPTGAHRSAAEIVDDISRLCLGLAGQYPVTGIGIGSPGHVMASQGVIVKAANLPFRDTPIVETIQKATGLPVFLGNDANCAALAEFYAGDHPEADNLVLMTLGTGVGGGIIINRRLYLGQDEAAGEIGHICIDYQGLNCRCGRIGCLEAYASVQALIGQTQEAMRQNPDSILAKSCDPDQVTGKTSFAAARAGCPAAAALIGRYLHYLAAGINSLVMVLRPDVFVLAGGITHEGDALLQPLQALLTEKCDLRISKLKNDAGLIGAAMLGRDRISCASLSSPLRDCGGPAPLTGPSQ